MIFLLFRNLRSIQVQSILEGWLSYTDHEATVGFADDYKRAIRPLAKRCHSCCFNGLTFYQHPPLWILQSLHTRFLLKFQYSCQVPFLWKTSLILLIVQETRWLCLFVSNNLKMFWCCMLIDGIAWITLFLNRGLSLPQSHTLSSRKWCPLDWECGTRQCTRHWLRIEE